MRAVHHGRSGRSGSGRDAPGRHGHRRGGLGLRRARGRAHGRRPGARSTRRCGSSPSTSRSPASTARSRRSSWRGDGIRCRGSWPSPRSVAGSRPSGSPTEAFALDRPGLPAVEAVGDAAGAGLGARHARAVPRRAVARARPPARPGRLGRRRRHRPHRSSWSPAAAGHRGRLLRARHRRRRRSAWSPRPRSSGGTAADRSAERNGLGWLAARHGRARAVVRAAGPALGAAAHPGVGHPGAAPGVAGGLPGRGARGRAARPDVGPAARREPHRARRADDGHPHHHLRRRHLAGDPGGARRRGSASSSVPPPSPSRCSRRGCGWSGRVHRLVHGTAAAPEHVVRRLGSHLSLEGSAEALLRGLAEDVGTAMRLESVTLAVPGGDDVVWGDAVGRAGRRRAAAPRRGGRHAGRHRCPAASPSVRPGERTLDDLANVVATAAGRDPGRPGGRGGPARLASARLAERRVIRREIHDGLGPSLAGLRLGLRGARNLLDTDPAAAAELLAHAAGRARPAGRRRADPVAQPAAAGARRARPGGRARRSWRRATPRTASRCGSTCSHDEVADPQVAAAAYGIVGEALVNVSRHSGASECTVRTTSSDGRAQRAGRPTRGAASATTPAPGVGSRSMRERAEEQGGRLEIHSAPGGRAPRSQAVAAAGGAGSRA